MQYISTRNVGFQCSASQALVQGLAKDGGLLTPFYIPKLPNKALEEMKSMAYQHRAVYIMKQFLEEFSVKELTDFANAAYGPEKFDTPLLQKLRGMFTFAIWDRKNETLFCARDHFGIKPVSYTHLEDHMVYAVAFAFVQQIVFPAGRFQRKGVRRGHLMRCV